MKISHGKFQEALLPNNQPIYVRILISYTQHIMLC